MSYNIHPILVHFPIAFLFLYSLLKIFPVKKWIPNISWRPTERILLLFGVIGLFLASSSGEIAKELTSPHETIVERHELFASITTTIYIILFIIEFLPMVNNFLNGKDFLPRAIKNSLKYMLSITKNMLLSIILSFLGILSLLITGLLGGVMVYGISADPLAPFILSLLGI